MLKRDIEDNIKEDTKAVILDASAIGSMDITAADQLEMLYQGLKKRGICFYITEHIANFVEKTRCLCLIKSFLKSVFPLSPLPAHKPPVSVPSDVRLTHAGVL